MSDESSIKVVILLLTISVVVNNMRLRNEIDRIDQGLLTLVNSVNSDRMVDSTIVSVIKELHEDEVDIRVSYTKVK